MALKVFVLENSSTKRKRQTDVNNAVREYLNNPKAKVVYDEETGKATVEGAEKKVYISITCANKVMLVALYEKPIGIDGEYLPRVLSGDNKVDYTMLADCFFAPEEERILFSPATVEMAGIGIVANRESFDRLTPEKLRDIIREVADTLPITDTQ